MTKQIFLFDGNGWWLKLDSKEKLNEYLSYIWDVREEKMQKSIENVKKGFHASDTITNFVDIMRRLHHTSMEDEMVLLKERQKRQMRSALQEHDAIYVNSVGGYNFNIADVIRRYDKEGFDFPCFSFEDIRIKQWPGGTHWYAYIGEIEIKDKKGNIKWETKEEAEEEARKYITRKRG